MDPDLCRRGHCLAQRLKFDHDLELRWAEPSLIIFYLAHEGEGEGRWPLGCGPFGSSETMRGMSAYEWLDRQPWVLLKEKQGGLRPRCEGSFALVV